MILSKWPQLEIARVSLKINKEKELTIYSAFPLWTTFQGNQIVEGKFCMRRTKLIRTLEIIELENYHLATLHEITDLGENN